MSQCLPDARTHRCLDLFRRVYSRSGCVSATGAGLRRGEQGSIKPCRRGGRYEFEGGRARAQSLGAETLMPKVIRPSGRWMPGIDQLEGRSLLSSIVFVEAYPAPRPLMQQMNTGAMTPIAPAPGIPGI